MAVFACRIVKSTSFEGAVREFGNTYHYQADNIEPFADRAVCERLAELERAVCSVEVAFVRWETWGPTDGTTFENVMRENGTLTGTGAINPPSGAYRELCSIVRWDLPRSEVTNRRRWLRKFLRMGYGVSGIGSTAANGSTPLQVGVIDALTNYGEEVQTLVTASGTYELCSAEGVVAPLGGVAVSPYLQTRKIGS